MSRAKTLILGLVALVAAVGAGVMANNWLAAQRASFEAELAARQSDEPEEKPAVEVLIAAENLPTGTFLTPAHGTWTAFPEDAVPESYFRRSDFADGAEETLESTLEGAVLRTPLGAGDPITRSKLVRPGDRGFLAAVLNPGNRAVSVPINATTGISGFVFPGDFVDILLTMEFEERRATETVLSDVRVLAVDQRTNDQEGKPEIGKTATLEVSPKEAEVIAVALEMGRLSLALRSLAKPVGSESVPAIGGPSYTWDSQASALVGAPAANAGDAGTPSTVEVRIVRRGEAETRSFRRD